MTASLKAPTLADLAAALEGGRTRARILVEDCLEKIEDAAGEGKRAFIHVDAAAVRGAADAMDKLRDYGCAPSPFAGIPLSIKDLFDVKGQPTRGGAKVLGDATPALRDAAAVGRLRQAGFLFIGRTNMTEFAYSGLGINPHFGTPLNPWNRHEARVPGGSSSGAGISVADGMAHGALGTDTGGSCRIPAAFTGLVGYKPTARRVPLEGALPLSFSLDSIGPIARSVACCASLDAILAGEPEPAPTAAAGAKLRLGLPLTIALDGLDTEVARAFTKATTRLSEKGMLIEEIRFPEFMEVGAINAKGGLTAAESYAWHRDLLAAHPDLYDPRVAKRILRGKSLTADDYIDLLAARRSLVARAAERMASFDALVMPTVAVMPPRIADLDEEQAYGTANGRILRNCTLINMIDGCAISIPIHAEGQAPVGLMLAAAAGQDRRLFEIAAQVEDLLRD